jgi:hypothetical protein
MEQSMPIIAQSRYEHPRGDAFLPRNASLLELPQSPILTLHILDKGGGVLIYLLNASDSQQQAVIGSKLMKIEKAQACDLFGQPIEALTVSNETVSVAIEPRRTSVIWLDVRVMAAG